MNNSCLIKSFPNGIVLHLDPEKPFADLLIDIAEKFSESRAFFKDAKMALAIKGRTLTEEEEIQVIDAITANSDLQIICLVGEDEETNQNFFRAITQAESLNGEEGNGNGQFYRGTLKNGQVLETSSSIDCDRRCVSGVPLLFQRRTLSFSEDCSGKPMPERPARRNIS